MVASFPPTELLGRGWRHELSNMISRARRSVLLAAPFVKYDIAVWLRDQMPPNIDLTVFSNIRAEAIASGALDIGALLHLARNLARTRIFALPNLHAKAFVADETTAIVTSGNLTTAGLDTNWELGLFVRDPAMVKSVRYQVTSYARLGSPLSVSTLAELLPLERDLRRAHAQSRNTVLPEARKRLSDVMREAKPRLAGVQVGDRERQRGLWRGNSLHTRGWPSVNHGSGSRHQAIAARPLRRRRRTRHQWRRLRKGLEAPAAQRAAAPEAKGRGDVRS